MKPSPTPGKRLRDWRCRQGHLLAEFADATGLGVVALSNIECGIEPLAPEHESALHVVGVPRELIAALLTVEPCQHLETRITEVLVKGELLERKSCTQCGKTMEMES